MTNLVRKLQSVLHIGSRLGIVAVCLLTAGCYDAEAMVKSRRELAIRAQLEEIDLGKFRITLPQPNETTEVAEIQSFATVCSSRHAS